MGCGPSSRRNDIWYWPPTPQQRQRMAIAKRHQSLSNRNNMKTNAKPLPNVQQTTKTDGKSSGRKLQPQKSILPERKLSTVVEK